MKQFLYSSMKNDRNADEFPINSRWISDNFLFDWKKKIKFQCLFECKIVLHVIAWLSIAKGSLYLKINHSLPVDKPKNDKSFTV